MQAASSLGLETKQRKGNKAELEVSLEERIPRRNIKAKSGSDLKLIEYELELAPGMEKMLRKRQQRGRIITFQSTKDTKDGEVRLACLQIEKQTFLQSLHFSFPRFHRITDQRLHYIGQSLRPLSSLQSLTLGFTNCYFATDEAFSCFIQGLRSLYCLQSLDILFMSCPLITDKTFTELGRTLKRLVSLQKFTLDIAEQSITDDGLINLSKGFRSPFLQSLIIDFTQCRGITDKGFIALSKSLKPICSLQSLTLNFGGGPIITDNSVYYLTECLKSHTSLEYLVLDFHNSEHMTGEAETFLRKELESLNSMISTVINKKFQSNQNNLR